MQDTLAGDGLACTQGCAFHQERAEAATMEFVQKPQPGAPAAENQDVQFQRYASRGSTRHVGPQRRVKHMLDHCRPVLKKID